MKKVVLALAVVFSVAMVSCGNKNAEATDTAVDTVAVEAVEAEVVDSANGDTTAVAEVAVEEAPAAEAAK
ncbi:MAG: hypothetical protein HDS93_04195 [Bacteroidales bacterium]|nr:hypothetical protein [Bacteroidales bacterium]MBD5191046.1 hypothetical protein [Bacteroidales bacterium]